MSTEKSIPKGLRHVAVSEKSGIRSGGDMFSGPMEGFLGTPWYCFEKIFLGGLSRRQMCVYCSLPEGQKINSG